MARARVSPVTCLVAASQWRRRLPPRHSPTAHSTHPSAPLPMCRPRVSPLSPIRLERKRVVEAARGQARGGPPWLPHWRIVSGYQTETTACAFIYQAAARHRDRPMVAEADAGETGGGGADGRGGRNRESESGKERWSVPCDARAAARDSRGRGSNLGLARRWGGAWLVAQWTAA